MLNIIDILKLLDHQSYRSGQDLADLLNVTRSTIHNCISRIEDLGIKIERTHGLGYRLQQPLDLLSKEIIDQNLSADMKSKIESLVCLQEVDSTNRYASELDLPPAGKFSAVVAEKQSAGKGRRGREWVSPFAANLYLSLVWPLEKPLQTTSVLSPSIAIAIAQMINKIGVKNVGVKWPNDISCDNKKLAGILIECSGELNGQCKMIVGAGLNVYMSRYQSINIDQSWTDIESQVPNASYTRNEIAAMLISEITQVLTLFEENKVNDLIKMWPHWDVMKNHQVNLYTEHEVKVGIARGINNDGSLLLETESGEIETIVMGEVSLRSA
ncbi:MAG: biotin--[acetyl-CoA-carboxylase] ligase [Pseudomonadota bacterium]